MAMKLVTAAAVVGMALGMPATPQRSESAALASKKSAEAPAWPESKLEAMAVAEKEAKLGCIDGVKVDSKVDVEVGYSA